MSTKVIRGVKDDPVLQVSHQDEAIKEVKSTGKRTEEEKTGINLDTKKEKSLQEELEEAAKRLEPKPPDRFIRKKEELQHKEDERKEEKEAAENKQDINRDKKGHIRTKHTEDWRRRRGNPLATSCSVKREEDSRKVD